MRKFENAKMEEGGGYIEHKEDVSHGWTS